MVDHNDVPAWLRLLLAFPVQHHLLDTLCSNLDSNDRDSSREVARKSASALSVLNVPSQSLLVSQNSQRKHEPLLR